MICAGLFMTFAAGGTWWREVGWQTWLGKSYALGVLASGFWKVRCYARGRKEDEFLRREFGQRWEDWARKVRYRYLPGVC